MEGVAAAKLGLLTVPPVSSFIVSCALPTETLSIADPNPSLKETFCADRRNRQKNKNQQRSGEVHTRFVMLSIQCSNSEGADLIRIHVQTNST